jgi:hypothetical protein
MTLAIEHVTDLAPALETVLNGPEGTRVTIDQTDWLGEVDLDEVESLYGSFDELLQGYLEFCMRELGHPIDTGTEDRDRVDDWYPEALRLASWPRADGYIFLALVHHDRETPIFIELGSISQTEIDELLE